MRGALALRWALGPSRSQVFWDARTPIDDWGEVGFGLKSEAVETMQPALRCVHSNCSPGGPLKIRLRRS